MACWAFSPSSPGSMPFFAARPGSMRYPSTGSFAGRRGWPCSWRTEGRGGGDRFVNPGANARVGTNWHEEELATAWL